MRLAGIVAAGAVMLAMCGSAFAAGPRQGALGLNLAIGEDIPVNGSMHGGISNFYPDLGPLFAALAGQNGQVTINSRAYDDFYGATPLYRLGFSYAYSNNLEIFLSLSHTKGESERVQIGTVASGGAEVPLYARFSDYRSSAIELGGRAWLGERELRLRPYVALRAGVARTDAITNTLSAPDANSGETTVPFYKESTGFSGGVDFGVAYELAHIERLNTRVEVGAEVGVRYVAALDEDDSVLGAVGAETLNDKSGRTSAPVLLTLRMRWGGR